MLQMKEGSGLSQNWLMSEDCSLKSAHAARNCSGPASEIVQQGERSQTRVDFNKSNCIVSQEMGLASQDKLHAELLTTVNVLQYATSWVSAAVSACSLATRRMGTWQKFH